MKKILFLILALFPLFSFSQEKIGFILNTDGVFTTKDGESFIVFPYEDKDANEIYKFLSANIGSYYRDPSKVMSGVDDTSIRVRATLPCVYMGGKPLFTAYYDLEFRIKDGRVRISAPILEDEIIINDNGHTGYFHFLFNKWSKNGEFKKNEKQYVYYIEENINEAINSILGLSEVNSIDDDW